jgi:hypothetical protein
MGSAVQKEFSRIFEARTFTNKEQTLTFAATPEECELMARRLDIPNIKNFKVDCRLRPIPSTTSIEVVAHLRASLVQTCGISLEDVPENVDETVKIFLCPAHLLPEDSTVSYDEEGLCETIAIGSDGTIDLGEIFLQYLSLSMCPYPRTEKFREDLK